jgi:WD40 repeat protein
MTKAARWPISLLIALAAFAWQGAMCRGQEPKAVLKVEHGSFLAVAFSPDGRTLAAGDWDGSVKLWDVLTSRRRATFRRWGDPSSPRGQVYSIAFSPDGKLMAVGGWDGKVHVWDSVTGTAKLTLPNGTQDVDAVTFCPDGRTILSHDGQGTITLWDITTRRGRKVRYGNAADICWVAFSPDRKAAALGKSGGELRLVRLDAGKESVLMRATAENRLQLLFFSLAFSPDGRTLALGDWRGTVRLFDAATGKSRRLLAWRSARVGLHPDDSEYNRCLAFSPDGKLLASCGGEFGDDPVGEVWLADVATGKQVATLAGHSHVVEAMTFSPDGKLLASSSTDGTVRLWDVRAILKAAK